MTLDPNETSDVETVRIWNTAIGILDRSEVVIRDLIERELIDVAGINHTLVGDAMLVTENLMKLIRPIRAKAIKKAFRYLREHL